jgi:hypothetical protein
MKRDRLSSLFIEGTCSSSSILISNDACGRSQASRATSSGRSYPIIVSFIVAAVIAMLIAHAFLAVLDQLRQFLVPRHMKMMRHGTPRSGSGRCDGSRCFFAAPHVHHAHAPTDRPFRSATACGAAAGASSCCCSRSRRSGIGLYRLAVSGTERRRRPQGHAAEAEDPQWALTVFFLVLGFATLRYIKIGIAHAPNYGEPYVPAALQAAQGCRNEGHLHRRSRDWRRAGGLRGRSARRRALDHPVAGAAERSRRTGRDAGVARQRDQGQGDTEDVTSRTRSRRRWGADQKVVRMFVNTAPEAVPSWRRGASMEPRAQGDRVIINGRR